MSSADRFLSGFAQTWRDQQKRLWDESSQGDRAASIAALEQAWADACQQWWYNLRHVAPQALHVPLEAALRQTRVCLSLALRGEQISAADVALMMNPVAGLHAATVAQQGDDTARASAVERKRLLASRAMMACTARIVQHALTAAREQLRDAHDSTPRELYARCANIMEDLYREQAGSEEFSQLVGQWVNAHVDVLAARRDAETSRSVPADSAFHESPDLSTADAHGKNYPDHGPDSGPDPGPDSGPDSDDKVSAVPAAGTDTLSHRIAQQMRVFSDKLAAGATSLAALPVARAGGVSANEVVLRCDGVRLLRYRSSSPNKRPGSTLPPLLVVYSLVNRPYILDLNDERSFIRALCGSGRDVYLIDWGYPREQDKDLALHDYINRYLHTCVTWLQNNCDAGTVDLIGICQGGPFALCYTALEPARVRRLALMVAPVDFHTDDFLLARWLRHIDVDRLVSTLGNVPGHLLNWSFIALKPVSLSGMKALELLDRLDCPRELRTYVQMEQWLQDNPHQAGRAFAEFAQIFVRDNALVNASARIGTRIVDLRAVHHKVLNIYAARDHIVPPSASRSLPNLLSNAQCTNREMDCGHVGVFAGRRTHSKVAKLVSEWFARAD